MNIIVIVRQTPDTETKVKITSEQNKVDNAGITWIINPYDEFAIEKALKIKEQINAGEVILLACGPSRTEEALRQGLAMGADRAVFIKDDSLENADAFTISKLIANELKNIPCDLILSGKKVIDLETTQIPIFVAEELGLPSLSLVVKFTEVDAANKKVTCEREADGAKETVEVQLPALITCDRGEDIPRYASITGIMKAKKKEIKEVVKADLGNITKTEITGLDLPPSRKEAKIFEGEIPEKVAALVKALREEAKVI
jgi:electron transfer flavoprotein beta subunit